MNIVDHYGPQRWCWHALISERVAKSRGREQWHVRLRLEQGDDLPLTEKNGHP